MAHLIPAVPAIPPMTPQAEAMAKSLLELTAMTVLGMGKKDERYFTCDDTPNTLGAFGPSPQAQIQKTEGTTKLLGTPHIVYKLLLEDGATNLESEYTIYIKPSSDDYLRNKAALVRAIRWFIPNFNHGTTFLHEESAI